MSDGRLLIPELGRPAINLVKSIMLIAYLPTWMRFLCWKKCLEALEGPKLGCNRMSVGCARANGRPFSNISRLRLRLKFLINLLSLDY